ncbi:hypothetical protein [Nordella sp. HKS 07]|uniref:hypothetical protein n=1 Tax=Nordella sp. HKS 07 TaxID=2712222 RepID=UPI001FEF974D|nr:hypothetical protein [Nordella sp. HKS 07]
MATVSDTGMTSHSGVSSIPKPMPREQNNMPVIIAVRPATDLDREIHMAGDDDDGEADGHDADKGRLLDDVHEDPGLEEIGDRQRKHGEHDRENEPDEIVEDEFDKRPLPGTDHHLTP